MVQKTVYEYIYIYRHKCRPLYTNTYLQTGFPGGASGKESACRCRRCQRHRFDPWVRKISWRRKGQPTPVLLPGKFHRQRSLVGYSLWGLKELDPTERAHVCKHAHIQFGHFLRVTNYCWRFSGSACPICFQLLRLGRVKENYGWGRGKRLLNSVSLCQSVPLHCSASWKSSLTHLDGAQSLSNYIGTLAVLHQKLLVQGGICLQRQWGEWPVCRKLHGLGVMFFWTCQLEIPVLKVLAFCCMPKLLKDFTFIILRISL